MSVLFFYGNRVFKVRRPIAYAFADFSDLERRRIDCEREVALNRRLAPDVYLGTATASMDGHALEHAVVMRRLPEDRNLAALVKAGRPVGVELGHVAEVLAAFHNRALRSPVISAAATSTALWQRWQADGEGLGPFVGRLFGAGDYSELTRLARRYLDGRGPLFSRRIAQGAVCDAHGDLQASDVFCLDDGPRILDCLEFDDQLRYIDVLADVAFLVEDLERLGAHDASGFFLNEYRRRSARDQPASLVHFYLATRAHVRLLVECLRHREGLTGGEAETERLLAFALAHLRAAVPRLVLVGGLPGSGKSTLAAGLARELGAELLSTDHARGQVPGRTRSERYTLRNRTAVYQWLCDRARGLLETGRTVVFDATWNDTAMRHRAAAVAREASAELRELRCDCPADVRTGRILHRLGQGPTESEATPEVAAALAGTQAAWPTATLVDTSSSPEASLKAALATLEPLGTPIPPAPSGFDTSGKG